MAGDRGQLRVLGIDPGLTRCGLAVVDGPPSRPVAVTGDCFESDRELALARRLAAVHDRVRDMIAQHDPDVVACERVLFSANTRTAMAVGQAAGVALLAAAQADVPVRSYTPTDVKLTVAGHGAADKQAVARMVVAQLRLETTPTPVDVTDAFAVAICHLARARLDGVSDAAATAASRQLAEATAAARRDARGGWEAVVRERRADDLTDKGGGRR